MINEIRLKNIREWRKEIVSDYETECFIDSLIFTVEDLIKPQWIPCSERLPDKHDYYMATIQFESGHKKVDNYVPFIIPQGNWNEPGFWDVGTSNAKVIAWMPCIKPYEIV